MTAPEFETAKKQWGSSTNAALKDFPRAKDVPGKGKPYDSASERPITDHDNDIYLIESDSDTYTHDATVPAHQGRSPP